MKNSSITEFSDYLVFNTRFRELIPSLTTLTTQILGLHAKQFYYNYPDYADIHDCMKNSFITDFDDFRDYIKIVLPLTTLTSLILETTFNGYMKIIISPVTTLATLNFETK